jgi:hypothetical protein
VTVRIVLRSNGVVPDRNTGHVLSRRTATLRANATEPPPDPPAGRDVVWEASKVRSAAAIGLVVSSMSTADLHDAFPHPTLCGWSMICVAQELRIWASGCR